MARGSTHCGRGRAKKKSTRPAPALRPLLRCSDQGSPVALRSDMLGLEGDRWVEPFLDANRLQLGRLGIRTEVQARRGIQILLHPGNRIGAVPLLSPSTRRVVAGLMVEPRFKWTALGAVFQSIGFEIEPTIGGAPQVPGSAREVPPWLLAAPVLRRIEALLAHQRRGFIQRQEERTAPRGQIEWHRWSTRNVPNGKWTTFPCRFPDPANDPELAAAVRWTLHRLREELGTVSDALVGRLLVEKTLDLDVLVGSGPSLPPRSGQFSGESAFIAEAVEAMGWVAEERGLGGSRALDGLAWDVNIDEIWEAWVTTFFTALAPTLGLRSQQRGTMRRLNWQGGLQSMGHLAPDMAMHGLDRHVWVDAKYKSHLNLLARHGWTGLGETTRDAHRADLHQALAYSSLVPDDQVDTILVYPQLGDDGQRRPFATSTFTQGRRRIRLILGGLPFGFRGPAHREEALSRWREALAV